MGPGPKNWFVLTVPIPEAPHALLVAQGLIDPGGQSVEEAEGAYRSFFPPPEDPEAFAAECLAALIDFVGLDTLECSSLDADGEWRSGLFNRD